MFGTALTQIRLVDEDDLIATYIDYCFEAAQVAEWCATKFNELSNADINQCISLCSDIADLTTLHARMMARDSTFHGDLAAMCADACEACADVVREAAESCREMSAHSSATLAPFEASSIVE